METKEIRGDTLAKAIRTEVRIAADELRAQGVLPCLAAVVTGSDPAVLNYAESKRRTAVELGIEFKLVVLPAEVTQEALNVELRRLAQDPAVHGILLELPLASGLDIDRTLDLIPQHKDIDGLTAANLGLLYMDREREALLAATAQACVLLAEESAASGPASPALESDPKKSVLAGRRVGIVGKGRTVGKPLIGMLLNRHATVTVCHSQTKELAAALRGCDMVFAAVGKPGLLGRDNLQEGQIVIDAGISVVQDRLCGDVDADSVRGFVAALTPVPQGVGPVTTALIFRNLIRAIELARRASASLVGA